MQEIGETRNAMAEGFMSQLDKFIDKHKRDDHYWILVHAKRLHGQGVDGKTTFKQVFAKMNCEPPALLGTMRIYVDNRKGNYVMEVFPYDIPVDESLYEAGEVVPEVYKSSFKLPSGSIQHA